MSCHGRGDAGRRRRSLRALAHTLGANAVFVAFAIAADGVKRRGGADALTEWRSAAACERRHCKPDGYGCYVRNGISHGFFLEYDRGTESARKYAAKFVPTTASARVARPRVYYVGFPTLLFVTTDPAAEHRIAEQAHRACFSVESSRRRS
jgi:protein involved in plasmid replication-relaxation